MRCRYHCQFLGRVRSEGVEARGIEIHSKTRRGKEIGTRERGDIGSLDKHRTTADGGTRVLLDDERYRTSTILKVGGNE